MQNNRRISARVVDAVVLRLTSSREGMEVLNGLLGESTIPSTGNMDRDLSNVVRAYITTRQGALLLNA